MHFPDLTIFSFGLMEEHKEITSLNEVVEIIARHIHGVDGRLDGIDGRLDGIDRRLDGIDTRIDNLEEGLDRRFAQAHGDIMQVMGAENDKLLTVVDLLHEKDVITPTQRRTLRLMKPFPKR